MELKLKPSKQNTFPLGGFLIKNASVKQWLFVLQHLYFNLNEVHIYPIPGTTANSIWGCLITTNKVLNTQTIGKNELCQRVFTNFYIPEKTTISPLTSEKDSLLLFAEKMHVFHPEFGLAALDEQFNLEELIMHPQEKIPYVLAPETPNFIPTQIKSFFIKPVEKEDVLKDLEKSVVPKKEKLPNEKLTFLEKIKLSLYKGFFKKSKGENTKKTKFIEGLESFLDSIAKDNNFRNYTDKMQENFEDLEKRNQNQVDKLMDMFQNNIEEALKYAIPLDENNTSRGNEIESPFTLSKRWGDFSLFGSSYGGNNGGFINLGNNFDVLMEQYRKSARELIANGQFKKAAFIYMKLLKNYYMAAQTLENGKLYHEAAEIYLKHEKNLGKAAECYEKGNLTYKAIELYEQLKNYQKVGDLYISIHKKKQAFLFYEKAAQVLITNNKHASASIIYKTKMENLQNAQTTLLKGWKKNVDSYNCLRLYFSNLPDKKKFKQEFQFIYTEKVAENQKETFLKIVEHEFGKKDELNEFYKKIGYEIIAEQIPKNPSIIRALKTFNKNDKEVSKDISRFRFKK